MFVYITYRPTGEATDSHEGDAQKRYLKSWN